MTANITFFYIFWSFFSFLPEQFLAQKHALKN